MEQLKNGVFIFLGVCILLAGVFIAGGLSDVAERMDQQIHDSGSESLRMIVQDGFIYMYDTSTGQVLKKEDKVDADWEEINEPYDY